MWWIGALIGFALGLGADRSSAVLIYTLCGGAFGLILQMNLNSRLDALKKSNQTLHEHAAAAINELRKTIANLEQKLKLLEEELRSARTANPTTSRSATVELNSVTHRSEVEYAVSCLTVPYSNHRTA